MGLKINLFLSMLPGWSSLAKQFAIGHFMAPINIFSVHHTAVKQGYGGLTYRERMGGLPRGPLALYGLIPALMSVWISFILGGLLCLPGFCNVARRLRDLLNTR